MTGWADLCIRKFGAPVKVTSAETPEGREGRGIISPITPRDLNDKALVSSAGVYDRERYLFIAQSSLSAAEEAGRTVTCGNVIYELRRAEPVTVGGALSHWEGVLRLKEGAGT